MVRRYELEGDEVGLVEFALRRYAAQLTSDLASFQDSPTLRKATSDEMILVERVLDGLKRTR